MRAVVTGANGFIGKELVRFLVSRSHVVEEINRVNTSGFFSDFSLASKQDERNIASGIRKFHPDVIYPPESQQQKRAVHRRR